MFYLIFCQDIPWYIFYLQSYSHLIQVSPSMHLSDDHLYKAKWKTASENSRNERSDLKVIQLTGTVP